MEKIAGTVCSDNQGIMSGDLGLGEQCFLRNETKAPSESLTIQDNSEFRKMNCTGKTSIEHNLQNYKYVDLNLIKDETVDYICDLNSIKNKNERHIRFNIKENESCDTREFVADTNVFCGTSLNQQKKLFQQSLCNSDRYIPGFKNEIDHQHIFPQVEIQKTLNAALEEVDELKLELDVCQQRLKAKYTAIEIIKKQAEESNSVHTASEHREKEASLKLAKDVNTLQFELLCYESSFQDSQQTWTQRFDCMCQENVSLTSKLTAVQEELRKANRHIAALQRSRDELLAMLNVTDRKTWEHECWGQSPDEFAQFSSIELAVLGACQCREVDGRRPCVCAYAASSFAREMYQMREEGDLLKRRLDDTLQTVDAYRMAFEEQLEEKRSMTRHLAAMATMSTHTVKVKAAVKCLLEIMFCDDYTPSKMDNTEKGDHQKDNAEDLTLPDLVLLLAELLQEKKEALLHQKLAGQMLLGRLQRTEHQLQLLTVGGESTHAS